MQRGGACCEPGLQTRPWRSSIFQEQGGGAHRAEGAWPEGQLGSSPLGAYGDSVSVVSSTGATASQSDSGCLSSHLGSQRTVAKWVL